MLFLLFTGCATINNIIHRNQKTCASSGQFILYLTSGTTTTACILWSVSACCASGQRFSHQQLSMRPRQSYLSDSCMFLSRGKRMLGSASRWGAEVLIVLYSSFCCSFFWKQTGKIESTASTPSTAREFQDTASPAVVSLYSVVPALIATKDGGATPVNQSGRMHVSQW